MLIRRAFYYWQFPAAVILPLWLLIGWGIYADGFWSFVGLLILCPILFLAMIIVGVLISLRAAVRGEKAVSWIDVGVLAFWHLMIIGFGFYGDSANWFAVGGVIGFLLAFWMSIYQLVQMGRFAVETQTSTTVGPLSQSGGYVPTEGETIIILPRDPSAG